MSDIPPDVVGNILSRLPVKPLLRFRCVSKWWCALIDSPYFIKSHLNRSIKTNNHRSVILKYSYVSSIDFDSLNHTVEFDNPKKSEECIGTEVVGSCNGLLCVLHKKDTPIESESEDYIVLCNPSTRKRQKLPLAAIELPRQRCRRSDFPDQRCSCPAISYGFGYDSVNDDYKVVRMIQLKNDPFHSEVKIYSLKSNSWRRIQDFPYYLLHSGPDAVLASGAFHWVVTRKPESDTANLIAAFDIGVEEYRLVPQPEFSDKSDRMNVEVLGGCLSLVCCYFKARVDVWVMKEYGVKESWTKLFSFALHWVSRWFSNLRPLAYSKCGRKVLVDMDGRWLFWYDLKKETSKYLKIRSLKCEIEGLIRLESLQAVTCLESLAPLRGDGENDEVKQQAEELVKKKMKRC